MSLPEDAILFVSYRRTDAGWTADLLAEKLRAAFGPERVFLDVRGIDAGDDFAVELESQLERAGVLLVLIGATWLRAQDEFGRRRLDRDEDWVRREIRTALERKDCRVIPVLIDDADLPDQEDALPEDISALVRLQRVRVRQAHSEQDVEALIAALEQSGFERRPSVAGASNRFVTDGLILVPNNARGQNGAFGDSSETDGRFRVWLSFTIQRTQPGSLRGVHLEYYQGSSRDEAYFPLEGTVHLDDDRCDLTHEGLLGKPAPLEGGRAYTVTFTKHYYGVGGAGYTSWTDYGRGLLKLKFVDFDVQLPVFLNPGGELLLSEEGWVGPRLH